MTKTLEKTKTKWIIEEAKIQKLVAVRNNNKWAFTNKDNELISGGFDSNAEAYLWLMLQKKW